MENRKLLTIYWVILVIAITISGINPASRVVWALESSLIILTMIILWFTKNKFSFSKTSYTLIFLFLLLGTLGAHYTYEEVPIENLKNILGTERNPHDRIIHFLFGALLYYPLLELCKKSSKTTSRLWIYLIPLIIIVALGAIYEIAEWGAAVNVDPQNAESFLGMQGDAWDAQKDMLLNSLGAVLALIISLSLSNKKEG